MAVDLIKYAFIAGEISPALIGRSDLTKYDLGLALAKNWFVDYRGGLSTRPGSEFGDFIRDDHLPTKFFEFRFSPDLTNTYVLLFGHNYIRFIQDGAYVLAPELVVTNVVNGVVTTSGAHGLTTKRAVKLRGITTTGDLNSRTFQVTVLTSTTFQLVDPITLTNVTGVGGTGGFADPIYEITSPYASSDLAKLRAFQIRDSVRLTHPSFQTRNLNRVDHDNWTLTLEPIGNVAAFPTGLTATPSSAAILEDGSLSAVYAVSAVFPDGSESILSFPVRVTGAVNFTVKPGSIALKWDRVTGAEYYIIYRSTTVTQGDPPDAGAQLGYLGTTKGTTFVDSNIIPDFTKAPYEHYDPFAPGAIREINITNPGTGYDFTASITVSGGAGSGFLGYGIVNKDGEVTSIVIRRAGENYSSPSVTFGGAGTGATATAEVSPTSGTRPSVSTLFQQRQVYAASLSAPLTLWASQVKRFRNFDTSSLVIPSDAYEFEVDSAEVSPILHLFPTRGGLLILSASGAWLLTGVGGGAVTPTTALADPQNFTGVSEVVPLKIGSDFLYIEGLGYSVRLLSYNDYSKVYSGEDRSILSNHLFGRGRKISAWAYTESPYKLVWGVREDGALLMFTVVKEQDVFAWTWGQTKGFYRDVIAVPEGDVSRAYVTVERLINGRMVKYWERIAQRDFRRQEEAWCVDCGLRLEPAEVGVQLEIVQDRTTVGTIEYQTLRAPGMFTGKEEWCVRAAGGTWIIDTVVSANEASCRVVAEQTEFFPEAPPEPTLVPANSWTMGQAVSEVSGLWHLEGQTVSIVGDGNVMPERVVTNGRVTLQDPASYITIGLPYTCIARTLPPVFQDAPIEARRKRVVSIGVRLHESRGLELGRKLDQLYPFRERTNEAYGAPIRLINGYKHQILATDWDEGGQTYFVQNQPLPSTLLALVPNLDIGDDPD